MKKFKSQIYLLSLAYGEDSNIESLFCSLYRNCQYFDISFIFHMATSFVLKCRSLHVCFVTSRECYAYFL